MNMRGEWKICGLIYCLLAYFLVYQATDVNAANPKAELRTKLLLSNIRSHLAKQVDEVVQQKECDSGLILCESPKEKEASPEESNEIPPPPKIRGHHKPQVKVNPKDVIQTMIHKVHKVHKKIEVEHEKLKPLKKGKSDENDDDGDDDGDDNDDKDDDDNDDKDEDDNDKDEDDDPKKEKARKGSVKKEEKQESKPKKEKKPKKTKPEKDTDDEISFPNDIPIFAPTSSAVKSELCRKHSRLYLRQLERYKLWALLMYDASAKLPSGILQGNVNQFGDFDECLTVNAVLKDKSQIKDSSVSQGIQGRYCLAAIDIEATADVGALEQLVNRAESNGFIRSKAQDTGYFIPRFTTINWGVCVPSSCSSKDVEKALADELSIYNETAGVLFSVLVEDEACVDREDMNFSIGFGNIITLFFYIAVASTSGYATYRDYRSETETETEIAEKADEEIINNEKPEDESQPPTEIEKPPKQGKLVQLLMAFSWKRNIRDILSCGTDDEISCVHGVKAIFTMMLYIAHKTVPLALTPYYNRIQLTKLSNSPASTILRTSIIYTDSFLLVSGVLTSYNLTQEVLTNGRVSWFRRLLTRFIRLTPPLLAVTLFYSYISEELGSGPLWGSIVGKNAEMCRENSWANLLYIQNFFDFKEMCAPQTHQLALDMQLSLMAPLLVYVLYHYDLLGLLLLQFVFLVSSALRYITTSNNELTLVFYHGVTVSKLYDTANLLYSQAIYRATPYVLGVTIGYYLKKRGGELVGNVKKPLIAIGWIVATCLGFLSIVAPAHLADKSYEYDVQEAAQYSALSPISWSLSLGWVIAACHLGYGGRLNDFLSCKPLLVLSRLSYSVYLVQFLVFNHNVGIIRTPKVFSIADALDLTEIATIIGLAFIVTMLFDLPMKEIKTILLTRSPAITEETETTGDEPEGEKSEAQEEPEKSNEDIVESDKPLDNEKKEDQKIEEEYEEEEEIIDDNYIEEEEDYDEDEEDIEEELRVDNEEEDFDIENEAPLRRTSRIQFDNDDKDFWVDDRKQEPLQDKEVDDFWGQDED